MSSTRCCGAEFSRREMLMLTGGLLGAWALGGRPARAAERKRVLRIAHLTDVHVQPELRADAGLRACLRHVQSQPDKPDLILNGGDTIMDSFDQDASRTKLLWELWQKVLRDECGVPVEHCIGNHDVWGWNKKSSKTDGSEPLYGKRWAMDVFGVAQPYRSFERAGWRFIVLDSTHPKGDDGYTARLDDPQFEWLTAELAAADPRVPILVLSHIPILSATTFMSGDCAKTGDWIVPGGWMHVDARRIKDLFLKHANVKLCLSGHMHMVDRVDYCGVTYLCNGAVSGAWWKGRHYECDEGYALLNLYDDGSFEREYVMYGWKAETG